MKSVARQHALLPTWTHRILACTLVWPVAACGGGSDDVNGNGADTMAALDDASPGSPDGAVSEPDATPGDDAASTPGDDTTGNADATNLDPDATPPDAASQLAGRGEPCLEHDECASNWCVPTSIGVVCVDVCVETCEGTDRCVRSQTGSSDDIYLCLPFDPTFPGTTDPGTGSDVTNGSDGGGGTGTDGSTPGQDTTTGQDASSPQDTTSGQDGASPSDTGTVGPDGGGPTVGDTDGDGIPDEDDLIPCLGFELLVYNQGVTAASIELNGTTVVDSSAFPTTAAIRATINPAPGVNELDLGGKLTGSPQDLLSLFIVSTDGTIWFETLFVRGSGPPRSYATQFVLDVECD
jgi:hypothetical protein